MKRLFLYGNRCLAAFWIFLAANPLVHAACVPPPTGLVGWWQAEGNGNDAAGSNNAVLINGVGYTNGIVGQAFQFGGVDGRVVVSNAPALNFGANQDFSIEVWINPLPSTTDYGVMSVVDKRLESGAKGYELNLQDGRIHCRLTDSTSNFGQEFGPAGPDLRDGNFHHVALSLVRNSTNGGNLYVDGQAVLTFDATGVAGDLSNTVPLHIGNHSTPYLNCFFKGRIDEVSLYNRALLATEVQSIYEAGGAGKCSLATPPSIIVQPQGRTVATGASVTFSVVASGTAPLTYQWRLNGSDISGATADSLTLTNVQNTDTGLYSVLVTNAFGSTLSQDANLTVAAPGCVPPPTGLVAWWQAEGNGADSIGGNTASLTGGVGFTNGFVGQAFQFDGTNGRVAVADAPALDFGSNQDFSIEAWISPQPSTTDYGVMSVVDKRLQSGAKGYEFNLSDGKIHCRLSDSEYSDGQDFGPAGPDLRDGAFHHVALSLSRNSNTGGNLYVDGQVVLTFDPTGQAGDLSNTEPFRIGNHTTPWLNCFFKGEIDEVSLYNRSLSSAEIQAIYSAGSAGKCVAPSAPSMISQPQSQTVSPGANVRFSVVVIGTMPLSFQWRHGGQDISGATDASLNLIAVQPTDAGTYSVQVTNAYGSATSTDAVLTLSVVQCAPQPADLVSWWKAEGNGDDSAGPNNALLVNGVGFAAGLVGQSFAFNGNDGRIIVPNSPVLNFGSNQDFSIEAWISPQPSTTDYGVMSVVDKRLQSGAKGYEFNLSDGKIHCRLSDSESSPGQDFGPAGPDLRDGAFHHVALSLSRNSNIGGNLYVDGQVVLTFNPTGQAGDLSNTEPFRIGNHATPWLNCFFKGGVDEVSVYRRALTAVEIQAIYAAGSAGKCEMGRPPSIVSQPQGQTVLAGASISFNVVAVGTGPLSYQWRHDGTPIFGATTNSLLLTNVQAADTGNYSVEVTNAFGSALSQDAALALISSQCAPLPQDIVGWWKAEDNGDDSAGTNNAVLTGGVGFTNGLVGDAFQFDGSDARVIVSNAPALNFCTNQDFSIEAWINPLPANTDFGVMSVVDKRLQSGAKGYEFNLSDGRIHCRISDSVENDGQDFGPAGPDLRDSAFHHVALTLARNSTNGGHLYVDGQSVLSFDATGVAGDLSNAEPLHIGNHATPELNCFFKGRIDEVSLYARALSAAEIQAIFDAGSAGKCAQTGTNHPPVATDVILSTSQDEPLTIPATNLLGAASDLDNDPLTLSSVAQSSTNGSTLVFGTDAVLYVPPPGFVGEDRFTYTVSDDRGGSASASVIIQIRAMNRAALRMSPLIQLPGGFRVTFPGIPAQTYHLQRADKVTGPWQTLTSIKIGPDGLGTYIDTNAPPSAGFYRMLP